MQERFNITLWLEQTNRLRKDCKTKEECPVFEQSKGLNGCTQMTWTCHALHTCASRVNPPVLNSWVYAYAWGYFEDVKPVWCGFREGVKPASCIHGSYERAAKDNRHWMGWVRLQGLRSFMVSPTVWAWLVVCCVLLLCLTLHKKPFRRIISLCFFSRSRSGVQILISPGCRRSCCRQQHHSFLCH